MADAARRGAAIHDAPPPESVAPEPVAPEVATAVPDDVRAGLGGCLAALAAAIEAADALGLDTGSARATLADARERLGLPTEAFVLALVGGTGVGKSSLLNALAGSAVSAVGVQRPTTGRPVAWLARDEAALDELLAWLGVAEVVRGNVERGPHAAGRAARSARLAVLDLPDLDSIDEAHRRRVEDLLPRLDAVVWVVDPEKYADAVLHDGYLRPWAPRVASQALVVNKADLLETADAERLAADARRLLSEAGIEMPVLRTRATDGAPGIAPLRDWIEGLAEAKAIVGGRLAASLAAATSDLADAAGVRDGDAPLVAPRARHQALEATARSLRLLVDLDGLRATAVAATTRDAFDRTGPLAAFRGAARAVGLGGGSGPDPRRHLERWRERGSPLHAAEPGAAVLRDAVRAAPPALRARLAPEAQPLAVARRLEPLLDRVPAALAPDELAVPSARGWPALGMLQAFGVGIAVVAIAWFAAGFFVPLPVHVGDANLVEVAIAGAAAGLLLRLALGAHARLLGGRWGRRLSGRVERSVDEALDGALFGPLDEIETRRRMIAEARGRCPPQA